MSDRGDALTDEPGVEPRDGAAHLPPVPGGWICESVIVAGAWREILRPRSPDAFLDDPEVVAANRRDDYMPYWSSIWPTALWMGNLLQQAPWTRGSRVLEVGCGIGLTGLAAVSGGDHVTFSDHDPVAVACAVENARRNGFGERAEGQVLDWRDPAGGMWPVIMGSDVTYERRNHALLITLVREMLAPGGVCWLADPGRTTTEEFHQLAAASGFEVRLWGESLTPVEFEAGRSHVIELRRSGEACDSSGGD